MVAGIEKEAKAELKCARVLDAIITGLVRDEQEEKRVERKCDQSLHRIIAGLEAEEHRDERALLTAGRVVRETVWKVARAEARRQRDEALVPEVINGVLRRLVLGVARGARQAGQAFPRWLRSNLPPQERHSTRSQSSRHGTHARPQYAGISSASISALGSTGL